jgi:hypothetical protein
LDFPWLGKCCVLFLLDLYIYFGFPLARLKWRILLKSVRLPLQVCCLCPWGTFFSLFDQILGEGVTQDLLGAS